MIHVCVPVLKRYDLLRDLLVSLEASTMKPDAVHVIDNGRDRYRLAAALRESLVPVDIFIPDTPMGVAESWNWFIDNVPEERVITNDDITFAPETLASMAAKTAPFVSIGFGFSCFMIRDACVEQVGLFDETISPGYAYFEDMDYYRRMKMAGVVDEVVRSGAGHHHSATPEKFSRAELALHHERFKLAQNNYEVKWHGKPSWDELAAIGGAGANT